MTDLSGARFSVRPHLIRTEQTVEVTLGSRVIANIYPTDEGLRVVSKHMTTAQFVDAPLPETVVTLELDRG